jgi:hypothetical protein
MRGDEYCRQSRLKTCWYDVESRSRIDSGERRLNTKDRDRAC